MENSKTTISGYIGLVGTVLMAVATAFPGKAWAQTLVTIGIVLTGANGVGNISAKDGGH